MEDARSKHREERKSEEAEPVCPIIPQEDAKIFEQLRDPISADELLLRLEKNFEQLGILLAKTTPDFFDRDRAAFGLAVQELERLVASIESTLIVFETRIAIDYPKTPELRRIIIWLMKVFYARANFVREISNNNKQQAYERASSRFRDLIRDLKKRFKTRVGDVFKSYLEGRRAEILSVNNDLVKCVEELSKIETDLAIVKNIWEHSSDHQSHYEFLYETGKKYLPAVVSSPGALCRELNEYLAKRKEILETMISKYKTSAYENAKNEFAIPADWLPE